MQKPQEPLSKQIQAPQRLIVPHTMSLPALLLASWVTTAGAFNKPTITTNVPFHKIAVENGRFEFCRLPRNRRFLCTYMREVATVEQETIELAEDILVQELLQNVDSPSGSASNNIQALSALKRATEIGNILVSQVMAPILTTLTQNWPTESLDWDEFWSYSSSYGGAQVTNAQRVALALEELGPTYVKFGQALGSRPDVVPKSLAEALSTLQDDMTPFDGEAAKDIVWRELQDRTDNISIGDLKALMDNLNEPVAAASIGQVYKAYLPGVGDVAVKVQRPGVRKLVERDTELLLSVAKFLESLPALPTSNTNNKSSSKQTRLINTQLVSATQEFMSRIFEELDYRNEAENCMTFANLYSRHGGNSIDVSVVVPEVYTDWCTENVLVMEWIEGTKLTDVQTDANTNSRGRQESVKENLELVKVAIDSTLSQLLVTGILHADPHAGNLLKVGLEDGSITLGYLDFGLLSTIPSQVRDALVCSVVLQVYSRDIDAVASMFGELQLIPQHVLNDPKERQALAEALEVTFENSLLYPKSADPSEGDATQIPELKFDKLLDSLSRLVPRFQFDLPPYFINNARALSTLEGIAKSLDPTFNVLTIMYPYALNLLIRNPSGSPVVASTLQSLIRSRNGRIDRVKIRQLLRDSALISKRRVSLVLRDILKTREGRRLARQVLGEELQFALRGIGSSRAGRERKQKRTGKRWFYLEL